MEYELKFKIDRKKDILPKLARLGAKDLGKRKETDICIGSLGQGLRLRKFGRDGLITHKSIVCKNVRAKVRKEIQTEVSHIDNLIEMLRILGFPEKKRKEKIRHTFKMGDVFVMVDRLPFMGYFVEIEARSGAALKRAARKFGFDPAKGNCDSYDNIFLNYYIVNAEKFQDPKVTILPTFASENGFRKR
ncbi:MAG: class IV adenylate cyclase [Candidatus Omnitrophota bacterium]|jgi:predicted adenylyl cyclase CyaB